MMVIEGSKVDLGWEKKIHGNQTGRYLLQAQDMCRAIFSAQRLYMLEASTGLNANKNDFNVLCHCEAKCFACKVIISLSDVVD